MKSATDQQIMDRYLILKSLYGDAEIAIVRTAFVYRLQGVTEARVRAVVAA